MSSSAKVHGLDELPQNYKHANNYQANKYKFSSGSTTTHTKTDNSGLEDAEAEVLERKRQELQKQLKMESQSKKKELLKKHKKVLRPSSTSDSSSSSDSGSSKNSSSDDSSSSSSSSDSRSSTHKKSLKRTMKRRRASSSSSDDHPPSKKKLLARKHGSHKKSLVKSHTKKTSSSKARSSRAVTPLSMRKRSLTPPQKIGVKQKLLVKEKHRSREDKDRDIHREKEKLRIHVKETRVRSKTPVKSRLKSRSPRRSPPRSSNSKRRSHEKRLSPSKMRGSLRRERSSDRLSSKGSLKELPRRHETSSSSSSALMKERDRRDKERVDREAVRNKERAAEALARCQERQRLAKEKDLAERDKGDRERLLPRPAERAKLLVASRGESHDKLDRDRPRSRSNVRGDFTDRPPYDSRSSDRRYHDSPTIRRDRDDRHPERNREHEYMIVRNRSDTRRPLRDDHEIYGEVPIEPPPRYEPQENRHMTHEYSNPRPQYHRDHEWGDKPRERIYDRQPPEHIPPNRGGGMQNEWERNDMGMSGGNMGRNQESYNENTEWKDRSWEEQAAPVVTKPPPQSNWQGGGGMKDDGNWEGYQESKPWHREMPPDTGRRWQPRRSGGHPGMNNPGDSGENRPDPPYRRPGMQHMHGGHPPPHIQGGDHMPQMTGPPGMYHHSPGPRHMQPHHPGPQDMGGMQMGGPPHPPGPQHFMPNQNMPPMLPKRMRIMEESHPIPDQSSGPPHDPPPPARNTNLIKVSTTSAVDEVIEDNLSEISDDADDILNSVESRNVGEDNPEEKKPVESVKTPQESADDKEDLTEKVKDLNDDFNLGFEEISDGELEEEARVKGLGDALGVDWASLVTESKAKDQANAVQTTSVRQMWKFHQVLLNVGISTKLAGEEFTRDLLKRARKAAEEEEEEEKNQEIKEEDIHSVADVQVAQRKAAEKRARLISQASGCHSRALNARRDLQIRRQLCGFPVQEVHYCSVNPELTNLALQHFKNKVTAVTT